MFEMQSKGALKNTQKGYFRRRMGGGGGGGARSRPHRQVTEGEGEGSKRVLVEAES